MARRSTATLSPAWSGTLAVHERLLPNGLRALVLPRHHAPVVVCDLYYPVGSFNEPAGKTGLAHFVEHMLFKGTKRFPKGQIDRLAFVAAGQSNAETGEDLTHYWFAFPSNRWELALAIEADRMRGAAFDPQEVEAERQVIAEERARDAESPMARLDSAHLTHSYVRHPYRNPILGWPDDLAAIEVGDLKRFYRRHYRPDGAVLVIVGDVDPDRALDAAENWFRPLAGGPVAPLEPAEIAEPHQVGRRDFTLIEHESVARGLFGWHTVPIGHPDGPALDVLSDILTCGRRSRLWAGLVEDQKLATWIDTGQEGAKRAGQFLLQVEAMPGVDHQRIDRAILEALNALAEDGPTPVELRRSRHRLEAAWRWEQEDLAGLAAGLGHFALGGDWRDWQTDHRAAIAVTAEDLKRVASTYLMLDNLTVGWSIPRVDSSATVRLSDDRTTQPSLKAVAPPTPAPKAISLRLPKLPARLAEFAPEKRRLAHGMGVLTEVRPGTGVVALELFVDAGMLREAKPGLAALTGRMLEEGTTRRSAEAMAEAIEDVGGALDVGSTGASLRVRAEDLPMAVEWLADLAIRPAFPPEEFHWVRRKMAAELQSDRDDPSFRADLLFRGLVYGDHPYARDPRGTAREIAKLTCLDVVEHHARFFAPDRAFLVAVGDFDPSSLHKLVTKHFGGWSGSGVGEGDALPRLIRGCRPKSRRVSADGEQVHILLGHLGVARNHPDFDALAVADHILGSGPGFTDRLSRVIRDEMGLAYSVGGGMTDSADREPGMFRVSIGTGPDEVDRAVMAALEQIRLVQAGAFGDDEVSRACQYLAGSWVFDYQTVEQRAERIVELQWWGLPLDEPTRWPDRIAAVTPRQVRDATRAHIDPNALIRVEYGPIQRRERDSKVECA